MQANPPVWKSATATPFVGILHLESGTAQDAGVTRVGDDNWIMAYVHVAHDCQVGNRTIFANNSQLAGHVQGMIKIALGVYRVYPSSAGLAPIP